MNPKALEICFCRILKLTDPEIDRSKITTDMGKVETRIRSNISTENSRHQITKKKEITDNMVVKVITKLKTDKSPAQES